MARSPFQRHWAVILFQTKWPSPSRPWPAAPADGLPLRAYRRLQGWISTRDWSEFSCKPMITCIQAAVFVNLRWSQVLRKSLPSALSDELIPAVRTCENARNLPLFSQGMWMKVSSPGDILVPWLRRTVCAVGFCPFLMSQKVPKISSWDLPFGILLAVCWKKNGRCSLSLSPLSLSLFYGNHIHPISPSTFPKGIQTEPGYCIFTTWIIMEINCSSWVAVSLCPLRSFLTFCVAIFATKMRQT